MASAAELGKEPKSPAHALTSGQSAGAVQSQGSASGKEVDDPGEFEADADCMRISALEEVSKYLDGHRQSRPRYSYPQSNLRLSSNMQDLSNAFLSGTQVSFQCIRQRAGRNPLCFPCLREAQELKGNRAGGSACSQVPQGRGNIHRIWKWERPMLGSSTDDA